MTLQPYPKYKRSGVEWLGEVPTHWEVRTLTSIASEIKTGPFGSQLHASEYIEHGIPVVNPAHIVSGSIRPDVLSSIDDPTALRLERHRLKRHDIIVGRRGEIGRCAVVGPQEDGWLCGTGALVVRLHNSDPRYISAIISGAGFREVLSLNAVGTTMLNLNPMILGRMLSPLPPLSEQRAIVDFLERETSRLDTLVAKKQTLIERLNEKRTAVISRTVVRGLPPDAAARAGFDPRPELMPSGVDWLEEVPNHWKLGKFSHEVRIAEGQVNPEVEPYCSMTLVAPNHIESRTGRLLAQETAAGQGAISGKYLCRSGDVLYCKIRPALAKVVLAPEDCLCSADMYPMTSRGRLRIHYLLFLLLSSQFTALSVLEADRVAMPKVNRETLSGLRIPVPPEREQEAIAEYLGRESGKIDSMVAKIETAIERLREYRDALMTAAVTGKIDVRVVVALTEDAA